MNQFNWLLIGIMVICGALGGLIGFFSSDGTQTPETQGQRLTTRIDKLKALKYIVIGIGAALLVPLFLNTISSDLITEITTDKSKILVFAGFCLLAAISSKAFIGSLSKKMIERIENADDKADQANRNLAIMQSHLTEPDQDDTSGDGKRRSDPDQNDPDDIKILKALANGGYLYRSLTGIVQDTSLEQSKVNQMLTDLINKGLVAQANPGKGLRWYITQEGREKLCL